MMLHPTQELEPPANPARFRNAILAAHNSAKTVKLIEMLEHRKQSAGLKDGLDTVVQPLRLFF
jgi:hypothetical protein